MRYGIEFLPHVSVMIRYYGPATGTKKIKVEGELCKGSGRGVKKSVVSIAPSVPVIENLELLFHSRYILTSAKAGGYPVKPDHPKASDYYKNGELAVDENGVVSELK
jgi:hypothetical protein